MGWIIRAFHIPATIYMIVFSCIYRNLGIPCHIRIQTSSKNRNFSIRQPRHMYFRFSDFAEIRIPAIALPTFFPKSPSVNRTGKIASGHDHFRKSCYLPSKTTSIYAIRKSSTGNIYFRISTSTGITPSKYIFSNGSRVGNSQFGNAGHIPFFTPSINPAGSTSRHNDFRIATCTFIPPSENRSVNRSATHCYFSSSNDCSGRTATATYPAELATFDRNVGTCHITR